MTPGAGCCRVRVSVVLVCRCGECGSAEVESVDGVCSEVCVGCVVTCEGEVFVRCLQRTSVSACAYACDPDGRLLSVKRAMCCGADLLFTASVHHPVAYPSAPTTGPST